MNTLYPTRKQPEVLPRNTHSYMAHTNVVRKLTPTTRINLKNAYNTKAPPQPKGNIKLTQRHYGFVVRANQNINPWISGPVRPQDKGMVNNAY
jgi:hypothetical protein